MSEARSTAAPRSIHVLRAEFRGITPKIYRVLEVRSDARLSTLHCVLQAAFGWYGAHLHQFCVGGRTISGSREDPFEDAGELEDEAKVVLEDVLPAPKSKLVYEYDFGDGWEVSVQVVRIEPVPPGAPRPRTARLTQGARATPPEDCGGLGGYAEILYALEHPDDPDARERLEWLDDEFNPEAFDADDVERRLKGLK